MAKMRNRNGYGTVVKLSGKRRQPYEVRVNTRMDKRNYPVYDVLGRYSDRMEAINALAAYNIDPYDINIDSLTFSALYDEWFKFKYNGMKKYSDSSKGCTRAAYKHCSSLYDVPIKNIKAANMQSILDNADLSHSTIEHIKHLLNQMFAYAVKQDYLLKDYSQYIQINVSEDDEHGVALTREDITKLWNLYDSGNSSAALPLILIYSGWRIQEFSTCKIDLEKKTMIGGLKTEAGKNRTVPIHSKILDLVKKEMPGLQGQRTDTYNKLFRSLLQAAGIEIDHTCHDCRHTFTSLLSSAGVPLISIKRLLGHANNDITGLYTHKEVEELRQEIEKI